MNKSKKVDSYVEYIKEYQGKMNLPGHYIGSKLHPALKAKTKAGGYGLIIVGIFLLLFYSIALLSNFSFENVGAFIFIGFSILLIISGIKILKENLENKK